MIRALIFDFDGLILDTEVPEFQSWQETFQDHGCHLPLEAWVACIGTSADVFDPYRYLETQLGRTIDRDALRARHRQRCAALLACQSVLPGIQMYLDDSQRLGLQRGVASSSSRAWVTGHLERLGLLSHFVSIRCADDVPQVKPDPALYHSTLEALGVRPDEAIAFEDSPNGILAAKRAGLFCVAVPNALTRNLPLHHADLQCASLAAMPLADLLDTIRQSRS